MGNRKAEMKGRMNEIQKKQKLEWKMEIRGQDIVSQGTVQIKSNSEVSDTQCPVCGTTYTY